MMNEFLNFNILLKIPESGIEINGLDIDFDICKNNKTEANKAIIKIWNLSITTYKLLLEKQQLIDVYGSYGNDEPVLIFRGDLNRIYEQYRNDSKYRDKQTVIELIDGLNKYYSCFIDTSYRTNVTSTQIINDCIKQSDPQISKISEKLPEITYNSFKAKGKLHTIIEQLAKPLGISFSIQNNMIQLITPEKENDNSEVYLFNYNNSQIPMNFMGNEIVIKTNFIPFLTPNDFIKCEFDEFSGIKRIAEIHSVGSNYENRLGSEIVIRINE